MKIRKILAISYILLYSLLSTASGTQVPDVYLLSPYSHLGDFEQRFLQRVTDSLFFLPDIGFDSDFYDTLIKNSDTASHNRIREKDLSGKIVLYQGKQIHLLDKSIFMDLLRAEKDPTNILKKISTYIQSQIETLKVRDDKNQFENVLGSPFQLGRLNLKNRWAIQPVNTYGCDKGCPSQKTYDHYKRYAESGAGLLYTGYTKLKKPQAKDTALVLHPDNKEALSDLIKFTQSINPFMKILFHVGKDAPLAQYTPPGEILEHESMDKTAIQAVIKEFVDAALLIEQIGGDGIDIKLAHKGLLMNFLMKLNQRPDSYGGSFQNRIRIVKEIIQGIRQATKPGFLIGLRLTFFDPIPGGLGTKDSSKIEEDFTESLAMIRAFAEEGTDIINISAGSSPDTIKDIMPQQIPEDFSFSDLDRFDLFRFARLAKSELKTHELKETAVVASGLTTFKNLLPHIANQLVSQGMDLIGLGRQALVAPNIENIMHLKNQKCFACNQCLLDLVMQKKGPAGCIHKADYQRLFLLKKSS